MSVEIDKRVVEMQFDNKQFERNVQASLNTLDKLKMALNFDGAKGLDSITKAANKMDLSNVTKQTNAVAVQFSALQVAGVTMVSELTKSFMNFGKNLWNISFGQIKSGGMSRALKIEQADFKMKALVDKMEKFKDDSAAASQYIKDMGDAIDWAVTGTAYGYDSAASVAAQLMTSGHDDVEQMKKDLRAVAGAAAMTGRSFDEMGGIFAAVAGQQKLMGQQLLSFSSGGVNAASTVASYLHKTEAEVRKMISKGQIDYRTFADAMYDAYGEAAGRADETYAGVLSNVKAQLSRLGQRFARPYINNMIPFLNQLKATIKSISVTLQPVADRFDKIFGKLTKYGSSLLKSFNTAKLTIGFRSLENVLWGIAMVIHAIYDGFREAFPKKTTEEVISLATSIEAFTEQILPTKEALDGIRSIVVTILVPFRVLAKMLQVLTKFARPLIASLIRIVYAVTSIFRVLEPIAMGLLDTLLGGVDLFDKALEIITTVIIYLSAAIQTLIIILSDLLKTFMESDKIKKFGDALKGVADTIIQYFVGALVLVAGAVFDLLDSFSNADEGTSWFSRLANNAKILWETIKQLGSTFMDFFNSADSISGLKSIVNIITELFSLIKNFFTGNDISGNINNISDSVKVLGDRIQEMKTKFKNSWDGLDKGTLVMALFAVSLLLLMNSLRGAVDSASDFMHAMTDLPGIFKEIKNAIQNLGNFAGPAQTLIAFAVAVSSITAAIVTLSKIPKEQLKVAAIAIGVISAVLLGFVLTIDIFSKKVGEKEKVVSHAATNLLALTASIVALALSLKMIATLEITIDKLFATVGAVVTIMVALVGTIYLLNKISPELKGSVVTMIGFSASIMLLVKAFQMLGDIDLDNLIHKMTAFGGMILMFGAAIGMAGSASGWAMLTISSFTTSVIVLFGLFMLLTTIPMDLITNAIEMGTKVFSMFIPLILSIGIASKLAGKGTKLGGTIWALVMSMTAFLVTFMVFVQMIKNTDIDDLKTALDVVRDIVIWLGVFAGSIMLIDIIMAKVVAGDKHALANSMRANNSFKNLANLILSMGASILLIGLAARAMKGVDYGALAAIEIYILTITGLVAVMAGMTKKVVAGGLKFGPVIALLGSLSIIIAALIAFQFADQDKLITSSAGLFIALSAVAILMGGLAVVYTEINKNKIGKNSKNQSDNVVSMLLSLLGVVAAFSGLLLIANNIDESKTIATGTALVALLGTMAVIVAYFAQIPKIKFKRAEGGIVAMYALLPAIGALCLALYGLNKIEVTDFGKIAKLAAGIVVVLAIFALIVGFMATKLSRNQIDKMLGISESIVFACSGFTIIASALMIMHEAIKDVDTDGLIYMFGALAILFAEMAVALELIQIIPGVNATNLLATGGSLAIMAAGLVEIASAFAIMKSSGASPEEIEAYSIAIGIMVAALSAVGAVLGFLGTPALVGIIGLSSAFLEFGAGMDFVATACLKLAEAVKVLGSVTTEEMNNVIDSIITVLNRTNEIVDAYKKAYPAILEGIQLIFRSIGVAIGTVVGEMFAQILIIGTAALVDNADIFLAGCYVLLRKFVDWLMSPDTLQLVYDTFYALGRTILLALAGLFEGISGIKTDIEGIIESADSLRIEDILKLNSEDLKDLDSYNEKMRATLDLYKKYSAMDPSEMTDKQKEYYEQVKKNLNDLIKEFNNHKWAYNIENADGFIFGEAFRDSYTRNATLFEHLREELADDNGELMSHLIEDLDASNTKLLMSTMQEYQRVYSKDLLTYVGEGLSLPMVGTYFAAAHSISDSSFVASFKEFNNEYGKWFAMYSERAHLRTNGFLTDEEIANSRKFGSSIDLTNKKIGESSNLLDDLKRGIEECNNSVKDATESTNILWNSYENNNPRPNLDNTIKPLNEVLETTEKANTGFSSFDNNIKHAIIAPKMDTSNIEKLHNGILKVDGGLKGIAKAGENIDLTDVSESTDEATGSNDDFKTSIDNATTIEEIFTAVTNQAGGSILNLAKDFKIGERSGADYLKTFAGIVDTFTGGKYDLSSKLGDTASAMFETADAARQYGMALVDIPNAPSGSGKVERWKTYYENGKRVYTDIEDFVNRNTATGRNAFYEAFGLSDDPEEMIDEAGNKISDALSNATSGLGDFSSAADDATDYTDKLQESLESALDVFTEFNKEVDLSSREVLKNFFSEIDGIQTWEKELKELATRGFNQNFIKELADEGPKSYDKVHALYQMTDAELTLFNKMYAEKLSIQTDTAKDIRQSFVDAGIMLQDEADKFATDIGTKYDEAVAKAQQEAASKKSGQMSATTKKNLDNMYQEIEKYQADTEFMNKWLDNNAEIGEEGAKALTETMAEEVQEGIIGTAAYIEAGKEMVETISDGVEQSSDSILKQFEALGLSSIEALKKSIDLEKALGPVNEFRKGVYQQVKSSLKLFDTVEVKTKEELKKEQISTTQMLYNMQENARKIGEWSYDLKKLAARGLSEGLIEELRQLGPESLDKVDAFVRMSDAELKEANSLYASAMLLPNNIADSMTKTYAEQGFAVALGLKEGIDEGKEDLLAEMYKVGTESSEGFKQGIDPDAAKEAMEMLGSNSLTAIMKILDINSPSKKTEQLGRWTVEGYLIGVKSGISEVVNTFKAIAKKSIDTLADNLAMSKFVSIGENIAKGIELGMKNASNMLGKTVGNMASVITSTFTSRMGIKSPSRVFAEYGGMLTMGLCEGLKKNKGKLKDALEETGEEITDSMAYTLYQLGISLEEYNRLLNDDASKYPEISNDSKQYYRGMESRLVEARMYYNQGRMTADEYSHPLAYNYGYVAPEVDPIWYQRIGELMYERSNQVGYDYFVQHRDELFGNGLVDLSNISAASIKTSEATSEMTNVFKELNAKFGDMQREIFNLGDRIDGMSVYIDGNALVGNIVSPIDKAMGKKVVTQKRGRV